ncbi:single-stranded DNA-binding protein [Klenkia sp. PcliD-1-E]|uniref:single-stranded DNA-binding protein n=1 Tax=Klenkia sp. PcliD-1-E TaxID=2954492 RepID=UPI00209766E9|nr:single-stranded DNA-binding protein [Klenkia sp. PcliD-1-E]MCO7220250.1 single-stranded DNA-binding protein [Klenkia sp. PcliD-1-E]
MSSIPVTVIGNVVDSPVRRRAGNGEVTKFRLASTERRVDAATGQWVDGDTFYVDVDAWNTLGGNVSAGVVKGDPVVVIGRISTSEYEVDGAKRSRTVIKASLVGHDLSRGSATFKRTPRNPEVAAPGPADPSNPLDDGATLDDGAPLDDRAAAEAGDLVDAPF